MQKLIRSFLLLCLMTGPLRAQINSGTIDYNTRTYFDFGDWMSKEHLKEMTARRDQGDFDVVGQLSFNDTVFSYRQLPREKGGQGDFGWWIFEDEETDVFFTDYRDSSSIDLRYVTDRKFILQDRWSVPAWNIAARSAGMKEIPLPTKLATAISIEGDTLTAYYTPSIPYPIGPRGYGGLPGAIVYLKVQNDGAYTEYKMISMQPAATPLAIKPPEEGKVVSREKYDKLKKRAREMQERRRRGWERN